MHPLQLLFTCRTAIRFAISPPPPVAWSSAGSIPQRSAGATPTLLHASAALRRCFCPLHHHTIVHLATAPASRCSHHLRFGCYSMLCRTTLPKNGCKATQWRRAFAAKAPLSCRSSAIHVELAADSRALQLSLLRAVRRMHVRLAAACRCPRRRTSAFDQALKHDTS